MADCTTMLQIVTGHAADLTSMLRDNGIVSACIQAFETEHAARIQAEATRQAGLMTLVAGSAALVGGVVAYFAAGRQVRLIETQHAARVRAFVSYVRYRAMSVILEVNQAIDYTNKLRYNVIRIKNVDYLFSNARSMHRETSPINWKFYAKIDKDLQDILEDNNIRLKEMIIKWDWINKLHEQGAFAAFDRGEDEAFAEAFSDFVKDLGQTARDAKTSLEILRDSSTARLGKATPGLPDAPFPH